MDMEHSAAAPPRQRQAAAAAAKKKPTTLLDAYEVECVRRELHRLVLKHNQSAAGGDDTASCAHAHGRRHNNIVGQGHLHHHGANSAKKATSCTRVSPSPSPSLTPPPPLGPNKKDRRRGARLLGRHAVAICSGTAAPVAGAPVVRGRGKPRAVALCSGTSSTAPVGCAGDRRQQPRGGYYLEVDKV